MPLSLDSLRVDYGATRALDGVSLEVGEAEAVGVVGPLAAGKTTLLRTAAGLVRPRSGAVRLDGRDLTHLDAGARARLGIVHVPADGGVFRSLTVQENLSLTAAADGVSAAVEAFPLLGERMTQRAGSLSGGEQRQLAIARGALAMPRVLLLDEPLMGLAPETVRRAVSLLRSLRERGVAMVVVEERPSDELRALVDRVAGLRAGRITAATDPPPPVTAGVERDLDHVDVETLGIPLSVRDRRALQTLAQAERRPVGELVAALIHEHVESRQEAWR